MFCTIAPPHSADRHIIALLRRVPTACCKIIIKCAHPRPRHTTQQPKCKFFSRAVRWRTVEHVHRFCAAVYQILFDFCVCVCVFCTRMQLQLLLVFLAYCTPRHTAHTDYTYTQFVFCRILNRACTEQSDAKHTHTPNKHNLRAAAPRLIRCKACACMRPMLSQLHCAPVFADSKPTFACRQPIGESVRKCIQYLIYLSVCLSAWCN